MTPVTIRSLVLTGALFKKGGYRSYSNCLSASNAVQVGAGYEWTQLLARTGDGDWEMHHACNAPKFCRVIGYHPEMRIYEIQ